MTRLEVSTAGENDLDEILTYSTIRFGDPVASDYFFGFQDSFDRLLQNPRLGRLVEEAGKDVRCLSYRRHRIFYEIDRDIVRVLRILHHSMDVDRDLFG
ncbi:type II toxin-antitoxin system RelE/ParE family toxin [Sphingomonas sp. QA11]|uniref:type II toxin-antitoxin system RelE/ParE family toxin n=1 Tax=Sphingomonas sp. QA11 TaxID=2950605 RepID=UPI00234929AD|nr:type II toxin-antitoxin system RelE/ParE family toxin [Sphingomonas sp. QA11]WCM27439.1 type II toxin-antitoxin system RelE/ParE family toxin [Sphingomonas sp. QA11]